VRQLRLWQNSKAKKIRLADVLISGINRCGCKTAVRLHFVRLTSLAATLGNASLRMRLQGFEPWKALSQQVSSAFGCLSLSHLAALAQPQMLKRTTSDYYI